MKQGTLWIALSVLCVLAITGCGGGHHHVTPIATNNFVFYAQGTDSFGLTYSIAGVIQVTADGNNTILGGLQDFNDGAAPPNGIGTSPQPGGDTIFATGSSFNFNPDGSGDCLLTLATSNTALGVDGVETFALSFANSNHALIAEFDGTATSLGSYDLQTLPTSALTGSSFSFTAAGVDADGFALAEGGVYTLDGSGNITGTADINDGGTITTYDIADVTLGSATEGTFGRGTVEGTLDGIALTVNYYIVSPEVIRIIDVDTTDTAVGSAYGQGSSQGTFTNSSIGTSVFSVAGVDDLVLYNVVGQFNTIPVEADAKPKANLRGVHANGQPTLGTFAGIADANESVDGGPIVTAEAFNGTYDVGTDGRGSFNFTVGPTEDIATFGVYAVDPNLNILDPNNSAVGLSGGALLVELDANLIGSGLLIPQVTSAGPNIGDIAPDVVFGAQGNGDTSNINEFELMGALATDDGAFAGEGFIDDPFGLLTGAVIGDNNATFSATFTDDGEGIGRYTSGEGGFVAFSSVADESFEFTVTAYDANGKQLFWIETDSEFTWGGPIEASTFTVPVEAGKKPANWKKK
ncbi:MAG: hypothetical protein ABSB66_08090 [Candidatus Acidiferrales bacterium]|jgi:hypothetical protein